VKLFAASCFRRVRHNQVFSNPLQYEKHSKTAVDVDLESH